MGLTSDLIIANCISFGSSLFTYASSWAKEEKRIYWYQVGQCGVLALAYIFFDSYAGVVTLLLCTLRNVILALGRYNKTWCICLASGMVIFGAYLAKNEVLIKLNIILDLLLWIVYEIIMKDVPSFIADIIGIVVAILAIIRYFRERKNTKIEK